MRCALKLDSAIDGTIIGGRGMNGTPGRAVAKDAYKVNEGVERRLMFASILTTGALPLQLDPSRAMC